MATHALAVAVLGLAGALLVFAYVYRDATRLDVARPLAWAALAAGPVALGVGMYLGPDVPTVGVIMTANTGLVLYTFERADATAEPEPAEPGELPSVGGAPPSSETGGDDGRGDA